MLRDTFIVHLLSRASASALCTTTIYFCRLLPVFLLSLSRALIIRAGRRVCVCERYRVASHSVCMWTDLVYVDCRRRTSRINEISWSYAASIEILLRVVCTARAMQQFKFDLKFMKCKCTQAHTHSYTHIRAHTDNNHNNSFTGAGLPMNDSAHATTKTTRKIIYNFKLTCIWDRSTEWCVVDTLTLQILDASNTVFGIWLLHSGISRRGSLFFSHLTINKYLSAHSRWRSRATFHDVY